MNVEQAAYAEKLKKLRHRCRTDLLFLCNHVLNYRDVNTKVHGPLISKLQQFEGGRDDYDEKGVLQAYNPAVPHYSLSGCRRRLFLDPRGFLKTTVLTIAHTIQWIVNYPDIRILVCHATGERSREILTEIKGHFQYNEMFRWLFQEHCPVAKKAGDFGNQEQFVTRARKRKWMKEPTVYVSSIESTTAGTHMEVIKCSDVVEKENVRTPERIRQVGSSFAQLQFLLDQPGKAWIDVEGTCYDYSDIYNRIMDSELKKPEDTRTWQIHTRGIIDDEGNPVWPDRFPLEAIERIRTDPTMDSYTFMAQYMNQVIAGENTLFSPAEFKWVPRKVIGSICHRYHTTVDLATVDPIGGIKGTEDFTVICTAGFDDNGRMFVVDVRRGRFKPSEVIEQIFDVYSRFHPQDIRIEDAAGARQIFPQLQRESMKKAVFPVLNLIKRDTRITKQERIAGLQAWFRAGDIRFNEDIQWKEQVLAEFCRFPRYNHDDIADAVADQMQNRMYFGPSHVRESPQPKELDLLGNPWDDFEQKPVYVTDKMTGY